MIQKLSLKLSHHYLASGASQEDAEVLAYGAECLMTFLTSVFLLMLLGYLTNHLGYLFVWSVGFLFLRMNLGGLHAASHGACIVISTAIGACSIPISSLWMGREVISMIVMLLCLMVAILIAPVSHPNKPIPFTQHGKIKGIVALTIALECLVSAFYFEGSPMISSYIVSAMVMATALAVAGLVLHAKG